MADPARTPGDQMQNPAEPGSPEPPRPPLPAGDPLLAARFDVPAVPRVLVRRPGPLDLLTSGVEGPLTLVNGPAGAGKTVLVADWVASGRSPYPTTWLTAEADDAPGVFWAYALEALRRGGVRTPAGLGRPARAEGVDRSLLTRLADVLSEGAEPVVLVIDHVDAATAPALVDGLQFLLRHACGGLRLVLLGRSEPLLPLHRYRTAGEITEVRNADLRFTEAETRELLAGHGLDIPEAGVRLLIERTEGWAAGLRLCALAMQHTGDPWTFIREFAADRTTIADYLLAEVLDAEPLPTQDLLLRSCIADPITPGLADALTGRQDAAWTLAGLARRNAFVEPVDGSLAYRLHPLFAEVLHAHLRYREPGLEAQLHSRAARWFAGERRLNEAVEHAAAAADWEFAAAQLVDNLAVTSLFTGLDTERLGRVFAAMPPDVPGATPALVTAACRLAEHDLAGCEEGLRRADRCTGPQTPAELLLGRALVRVLAGRLAADLPAAEEAAADAEGLLAEVPPRLAAAHPEIRALVLAGLGSAELGAGNLDRAETELVAAVEACGPAGTEYPLCDSLGALALVELLQGRLRKAEAHARESLAVAEGAALPPDRPPLDHLVLAGVAAEHDDLPTARSQLALATTGQDGLPAEPVAAVGAAVIGARLAVADGEWQRALALLHTVGRGPVSARLSAWTVDELAIAEAHAHLAHRDPAAALRALDAAPSGRPEHTVAEARALLADGQRERALELLAALPGGEPGTVAGRTQVCLLRAQAAADGGQSEEARRLLGRALGIARPEELRRVFVESGPWVRRLLGVDPHLAQAHSWLPARTPGGLPADARGLSPGMVEQLSEREREVLDQAAQMLSTEEIAAALYVSANTVKTHLKSIYRKLCVTRRSEAVRRARELGML
ncbi:LuxR C-terminal-related transcriptional regulator [Kitasatospora sp. NPDC097643]|uniref:LuxR C-terminal-related transcriptional regulator n=1 Tax=Kitasatospora sp. NPDC097643 TaxID=3157230 RepID=UPI0033303BB9